VFEGVWKSGVIPEDWKRGIILPFYKGKGSKSVCKNYRGITLLSVPGMAFANILLGRVRLRLIEASRREQSGFTSGRSTTDRILALNVLMQTRSKFNQPIWIAYVDLKVAFDSIHRAALWLLLRSIGLSDQIVSLMRSLYTDMVSCVRVDGDESGWFGINSGVHQGCTLAPNVFLAPIDWTMSRTVSKGSLGATVGDS